MRDIVERLRNWVRPSETHVLNKEAATEIERLRAALEQIADAATTPIAIARKALEPSMKLFIWEGDGVLTDYTNGMIVAMAPDLEGALQAIKAKGECCMGSFPPIPTETVEIGSVITESRAWVCCGGG
jgi:hypothetical protein